ncbi:MAG: type II toxin-antitoxin system VapC family toxin [Lautropia sp.]|nr:type II toxin-antitoxin system VapC family toxin [Lautropia sp.]
MNLLLDTHIALWAISDSPRLSGQARKLILSTENRIWVSAATVWEIAIKHALRRGQMPLSGEQALGYFRQAGYALLPIKPEHAAAVDNLSALHHDPFDRILVAQARVEPMRLVTHDATVAAYDVGIILV